MIYANRQHAGEILAKKFSELKLDKKKSIVAAIPRGGVVVGQVIAEKLGIRQTVIVIKKLGAPQNPELAIGATASFGKPVLDRWLIADLDVSGDYLKKEIIKKKKEAFSRERLLGVKLIPSKFKAKIVIVVDDGLATGQTAKAAAKIIRKFGPKKLILGVACAAPSTLDLVKNDYDEVICPLVSSDFWAVGQFYRDFRPIDDIKVKDYLLKVKV
ncbi:hypothetical protein A3B52_00225 [Candidatus Curtissbacteria bacterium RIFCSPLOWO2_01_FULL_41_28]|nr:MAG: Phosphoribosyltransferase [Candidatus Curtissbacteria bacterium GW2011_GWD1_40_8]OGD96147.1 MAG: hypothetical protein A3B52_00225 [Candidatus Curtissbacteria bacterium RIFCSPLOWO2_01_FULL_41_28]